MRLLSAYTRREWVCEPPLPGRRLVALRLTRHLYPQTIFGRAVPWIVLTQPGQQLLHLPPPAVHIPPRPDVDALCAALAANSTVDELVLVGAWMSSHNDAGARALAAFLSSSPAPLVGGVSASGASRVAAPNLRKLVIQEHGYGRLRCVALRSRLTSPCVVPLPACFSP